MALFWVGGTGNWSDTAHWSATSGGAGGQAVPTAADNVTFDAASNATAYTVTLDATGGTKLCLDITFAAPGSSGNVTWAGSTAITISGSLALYSGLIRTYSGIITFNATSLGKTITMAGTALGSNAVVFNGLGGEWTNVDAVSGWGTVTLTAGSWVTNNQTITLTSCIIAAGSTARAMTCGSSTITTFNAGTTNNNMGGTNFTFNAGTSTFIMNTTGSGTGVTFGTSQTYFNLTFQNSAVYADIRVTGGPITVSNNLTFTGTNANTQRLYIAQQAQISGTQFQFTCNGTVAITNTDFEDILASGSAVGWGTGTSVGNCGGNSGITFTTPRALFWVGDTGNLAEAAAHWSLTSGGAGGQAMPLPQDSATFDAASFTIAGRVVTNNVNLLRMPAMNWAAVTNGPTFTTTNALNVYGSYTLAAGMTLSGVGTITMSSRSVSTLTTAGQTLLGTLSIHVTGTTLTLGDALTTSLDVSMDIGTLTTANFAVTCAHFLFTATAVTHIVNLGSSTLTLTGTGTVWSCTFGDIFHTINAGTSTIKVNNASASSKTFTTGIKTYNILQFTGAGTGIFIVSGTSTFSEIRVDTPPHTIQFVAAQTYTVALFTATGTPGNLITITSTTAANHTLRYTGSTPMVFDYLDVSRSNGSPGYKWFAGTHSVNSGNNTGWIFGVPGANKPQEITVR